MRNYFGCELWSGVRIFIIVVNCENGLIIIVLGVYWVVILFVICIIYVVNFVGCVI